MPKIPELAQEVLRSHGSVSTSSSVLHQPDAFFPSKLTAMGPDLQLLDPDSDVVLTLTRYLEFNDISEADVITHDGSVNSARFGKVKPFLRIDNSYVCEEEVVVRVSSKHLILASPVFRAMLQRKFNESNVLHLTGSVEIPLPDDDPDAFLILLNIIHGRIRKVPVRVDLLTLTQLAILVDKYGVHEVVEVFSNIWFDNLKHDIPQTFTDDIPSWICICWVFAKPSEFKQTTRLALRQGRAELQTDGLPIPLTVSALCVHCPRSLCMVRLKIFPDAINSRRQEALSKVVSTLHSHLDDYMENEHCSFECDSLMLGALTKRLRDLHILPSRPDPPYAGLCFEDFAHRFRHGMYFPAAQRTSTYYYSHSKCAIRSIDQTLAKCEDRLAGLDLDDFKTIL